MFTTNTSNEFLKIRGFILLNHGSLMDIQQDAAALSSSLHNTLHEPSSEGATVNGTSTSLLSPMGFTLLTAGALCFEGSRDYFLILQSLRDVFCALSSLTLVKNYFPQITHPETFPPRSHVTFKFFMDKSLKR